MKLPEIAILVSSVSVAITGGNAILTYRTFRRVRPKIKVRLWRVGLWTYEAEDQASEFMFILRLLNSGTTPVSVERIELVSYASRLRCGDYRFIKGVRFIAGASDEPPVVPALDGTTYRFHLSVDERNLLAEHLRFQVLLSNGCTVTSRLLTTKRTQIDIGE